MPQRIPSDQPERPERTERTYLICDICEKEFEWHDDFYDNDGSHYCEKCVPEIMNKLKYIERKDYTIEQKPRIWSCNVCGLLLGGGYNWWYYDDFDVCEPCWYAHTKDELAKKYISDAIFVNGSNPNKVYKMNDRERVIDVTPFVCDDGSTISECSDDIYAECIVNYSGQLGSVCDWESIINMHDLDFTDAMVGLLRSRRNPNHVASILSDNHGRISIDIVYTTKEEYDQAYKDWSDANHDKYKKIIKENDENGNGNDSTHDDYARACKTFSGYVRFSNKLDHYYG